ncbi:fibrillin-1-like, partial [Limulus polyphemus]|uniref:Fibrillin-1-like n=1 Tax=Limulus polyphemus TaxID=6850 RepID=A0ABM1SPK0_LIMPO
IEPNECEDDDACSGNSVCRPDKDGVKKCVDVCKNVQCGPNAVCNKDSHPAACNCLSGFFGDPKDPKRGCQPPHICEDDNSCLASQLCKPDENGVKKCFDVCEKTRCGPNAECIGKNHKPECQCLPGFSGIPTDLSKGCEAVPEDKCQKNDDCSEEEVCQPTESGIKDCMGTCSKRKCGPNAQCLGVGHTSICECLSGFSGDPNDEINGCKRDICTTDDDCLPSQVCHKESLQEIKDCVDVCKDKQCGSNAECIASNHQAQCTCKPGFEGDGNNLQKGCLPLDKCKTNGQCPDKDICKLNENGIKDCIPACLGMLCGPNTVCTASNHRAQCTCQPGYTGNPYDQDTGCSSIPPHVCDTDDSCPPNAVCRPASDGIRNCYDACAETVCGQNAQCISTNHHPVCTCIEGFNGDPYNQTVGCVVPHQCDADENCDPDKVCREDLDKVRKCVLICVYAKCKPSATCQANSHQAVCVCPEGTTGDPSDVCTSLPNVCEDDSDCSENDVCRPTEIGTLDCFDACNFITCGPNAMCKLENSEIICECKPDHKGDPYNLVNGCKPPTNDECEQDTDCKHSQDVCKPDNSGIKHCVDACRFASCGANSDCIVIDHIHRCQCKPGFVKDPNNFLACIPQEPDQCKEDNQCPTFQNCKPNNLGTLKCAEICIDFTCIPNSECIAINHKGQCKCKEGYTGDPNKRDGCAPIIQHECETSNDCLSMSHDCQADSEDVRRCVDACEHFHCGPNAVCVAQNHNAECLCPPGLFDGDPYDLAQGCQKVECLKDEHCDSNRACAHQHYCYDPCVNNCAVHAVCLVENHKAVCHCRPGYTGDPYSRGCESIKFCESEPCHSSAKCVNVPGSYRCHCPPGYLGNPYNNGCRHPNSCPNGDSDCPTDLACIDHPTGELLCKNPCDQANCGRNSECQVIDHVATCSCPDNFHGNPTASDECVRVSQNCSITEECDSNQACISKQCRLFCTRDKECASGERCIDNHCVIPCFTHSNCPLGEACILDGFCQIGCRENSDCDLSMACIQNKCENPCKIVGVCGPNTKCNVRNHEADCTCPPGFEGNPLPVLGCKRTVSVCSPATSCTPPMICVMERCRPPCDKCVEGEKCVENVCMVSCISDSNCLTGEICINQYCQVGCRSNVDCHLNELCDSNRCTCKAGFQLTASGCTDIDECRSNPCHQTAICENSPGSYYCRCRTGEIGDGFKGCHSPGECPNGNTDCPPNSACSHDANGIPLCVNPCDESPCGPNAECTVYNHKPECFCPKNGLFTGNPYDKQKGCFKVDCLHDLDCAADHYCLNFKCKSPCNNTVNCGPQGTCVVRNHQAMCRCQTGYENNNQLTCIDKNECQLNPCHSTAICENVPGSYICKCPVGLVGNPKIPPGCHDPNICYNGNSDCLDTAACVLVEGVPYCKDPCDDPTSCGANASCKAVNHQSVCSCSFGFTGNPEIRCMKVECIKSQECHNDEVCLRHRCVDACLGQTVCGENTICIAQDHSSICRCQNGYYGDPVVGCREIIQCIEDQDCPSGEFCYNGGVCRVTCNSNRDCGPNERCAEGKCITICQGNSECPEGQACVDEKCTNVDRCSSNADCEFTEVCRTNSKGYDECQDPCATELCGRNAVCVTQDRSAICKCPPNFVGNPLDDIIGCQKADCITHEHCKQDKVCQNSSCVDPCSLHPLCGENAYCISQSHAAICRCRNGYEGDPLSGCQMIDHCIKRPCHPTAICENRFGGYECQCPPDKSIGNPYNHPGCRGPNECPSGNIDCPPSAACVSNGLNTPVCKNPCQLSNNCGPNAVCKVENHRALCECPELFSGDPEDSIRGCVRVPSVCENDRECPAGFECSSQFCKPTCESIQDCAVGEFCVQGICVQGCQKDSWCFKGEICVAGKCLVGCHFDADCTSKESCVQKKCQDPCESINVCGTNALCRVENHNHQCICPPGFSGDPQEKCVRVPSNCASIADCPFNHFCIRGQCLVECSKDDDCAVGEKCFNNHCVELCHSDSNCKQNEICVSNHCEVGCRAGEQCPDQLACVRNQCRDPCEGSATCGPNAKCKVVNHRPVCFCPPNFVGRPNANVGCIRVTTPCNDNTQCPLGYYCFNGFCRVACSTNKDCAVNEKCSSGRCIIQCLQDRDCPSGEICEQNLCRIGCRGDSDCPFNEACISNQCHNPCDNVSICGTNALCQVTNHLIDCVCPPELTGDPREECNRVSTTCSSDNECGPGKYCEASMCTIACSSDTECLDNEKCIDHRCSVICTSDNNCPDGYICEKGQCSPGCRNDYECPLTDTCINLLCINPCSSPTACGTNAQCQPVDHQPFCICLHNYTGDPRVECIKVDCFIDSDCGASEICQNYQCTEGCRSDNSCPTDKVCSRRKCVDPCRFSETCGVHAVCKTESHELSCNCPSGFFGNPLIECVEDINGCSVSADCEKEKVCEDNKCVSIREECENDSQCQLGEICQLTKCFEGCRSNANCPFDQICISGHCQNPCLFKEACGLQANCFTERHEKICTCPPGFTGNARIECQKIGICNSDEECLVGTICQSGQCVVLPKRCSSDNDCAQGQICEDTSCVYGCRSHSDCEFFMACMDHQCQDPCSKKDVCHTLAVCHAINHHAVCHCPEGYTGNAKIHCNPVIEDCSVDIDCELGKLCISNKCIVGCRIDSHCPYDKSCVEGYCKNPCQLKDACGVNTLCHVINHKVECIPDGTHCENEEDCNVEECCSDMTCDSDKICENGKCVVGCRRDSDCTFDKACINSQCIDPCSMQNVCSRNADCRPVVHRPLCTCKPGFTGQPSDYCKPIPGSQVSCNEDKDCEIEKICEAHQCIMGCRDDSNCPLNKACITRQCQNPCTFPESCGKYATCVPNNHRPVCTCPVSFTGDPNVQCTHTPIDVCTRDEECSIGNICEEGTCIDACRTDNSCPYDKSCINKRCQNPCSFYGTCGIRANCRPVNHEAVCSCPPDYIGNADKLCVPETTDVCKSYEDCGFGSICVGGNCQEGCLSDNDCSSDLACISQHCQNPCTIPGSCGINATCISDFHRPICSCKIGYVGDPYVKCTLGNESYCTTDAVCPIQQICESFSCVIGCRSDHNCAFEEACINRICQNPCSVFGACGRNSICEPINHQPECSCPPNFRGNPNVICSSDRDGDCNKDQDCELGEICNNNLCIGGCRDHNNCPNNKICFSGQCQNPCLLPNSCGQNAMCQPVNHEVVCSCPENFIGNPYVKCHPVTDPYCKKDVDCPIGKICKTDKCIVGCRSDANCGFKESCLNNHCQNPCKIFGACGENAECRPHNHDRVCTCLPQFTGNPRLQCVPIPVIHCKEDLDCLAGQICEGRRCSDGCRTDSNCPTDKACIRSKCVNPCDQSGVCGKNAYCIPVNHFSRCRCPSGFTGNPEILCKKVDETQCKDDENCAVGFICHRSQCIVGCRTDSNCAFDEACINTVCQNPCLVGGACGVNTLCRTLNHTAVCTCLPGYTGSPRAGCSIAWPICEVGSDCGNGFVCVNQNCKDINECLQGHSPCAVGAVCTNLAGSYKCSCPPDLIGEPYTGHCHYPECREDSHCKPTEGCNVETKTCYKVCSQSDICGKRAKCKANNHHAECYCPSGLTGNPNLECTIIQQCVRHEECLGNLLCIGDHCGCPPPLHQEGFFCILENVHVHLQIHVQKTRNVCIQMNSVVCVCAQEALF